MVLILLVLMESMINELDWSDQLSTYTVSMWVISNAVQQTNYDAFLALITQSSGFQIQIMVIAHECSPLI